MIRTRLPRVVLLAASLAISFVHAAHGEPILTGSDLKTDDLILKADVIYGGKITSLGTLEKTAGQAVYRDVKIEYKTVLRSWTPELMRISLPVDLARGEAVPIVGESYIVFLREDGNPNLVSREHPCPCTVIKLLQATPTNLAELHRLIELPVNSHELPGSMVKLPEAAKAEDIFVGTILDISPYGDLDAAGGGHFWPSVKVTRVLRGWMDNPTSVQIFVTYNPHEVPPLKGSSYIFFSHKIPGWNLDSKLLPATDESIKEVSEAMGPSTSSNDFFCGEDLQTETALIKSDAIFLGTVEDAGSEDTDHAYSFAYPALHRAGIKIAIEQTLRGDVKTVTTVTAFVRATPSESDQIRRPYIFYVKKNASDSHDPFTVLKALPKTDASLLETQQLLIPSGSAILCGSKLPIEVAADKSDSVFVAAITELGGPNYHQPDDPANLDTYSGRFKAFEYISARHPVFPDIKQTLDHARSEQPTREGSSYIFFVIGRTAVKILPATNENLTRARNAASRVIAHGAETKPPGYFSFKQIDIDQKALAARRNTQTKLPGSDQKTEDVISKCNVVFEGQVLKMGGEDMDLGSDLRLPDFDSIEIKVIQVFRGSVGPVATNVDYEAVDTSKELVPQVGSKCLFLTHQYAMSGGIGAGTIRFKVLKVLTATDGHVAEVKRLLDIPADAPQ